jgi:Mg2+ and Co2+ transporter CorA
MTEDVLKNGAKPMTAEEAQSLVNSIQVALKIFGDTAKSFSNVANGVYAAEFAELTNEIAQRVKDAQENTHRYQAAAKDRLAKSDITADFLREGDEMSIKLLKVYTEGTKSIAKLQKERKDSGNANISEYLTDALKHLLEAVKHFASGKSEDVSTSLNKMKESCKMAAKGIEKKGVSFVEKLKASAQAPRSQERS